MSVHPGASIPSADPAAHAGLTVGIHHSLERAGFPSPIGVNSGIRARRSLVSAELGPPNAIQLEQKLAVEAEGEEEPACAAEALTPPVYAWQPSASSRLRETLGERDYTERA